MNEKVISLEFYQRLYAEVLIPKFEDEKDYVTSFLLCLQLAKRLPYAKRLWLYTSESAEKLNIIDASRRSAILNLHLHPTDVPAIEHARQIIETYGPHNGQSESLRQKQLEQSPMDFDLRMYYFTRILAKYDKQKDHRYAMSAFQFIKEYLFTKYVQNIDTTPTSASTFLNTQGQGEFRTVAEEFAKHNLHDMACEILLTAVKLAPYESSYYYMLYEQYSELEKWLLAFKAFTHYMYVSGGNGSTTISPYSVEQYATCGELLEKISRYHHAFLMYYQCHMIEQQEQQFQNQNDAPVATKYLKHIQEVILPRLSDQEKQNVLLLSQDAKTTLELILSCENVDTKPVDKV